MRLDDASPQVVALLESALPALVLERIGTPRWLHAVADAVEGAEADRPDWV